MKFISKKRKWTHKEFDPENPPDCSECGTGLSKSIKFEDYEGTMFLCKSCLNDAITLINDYTD